MQETFGVDIIGFGPIGRELAKRIATQDDLLSKFVVSSISDTSGKIIPSKPSAVLEAVEWKNQGRKLAELKLPTRNESESSIVVDVTNSDYTKPKEAKKRAIDALNSGKHFVSANKVALSHFFSEILDYSKKKQLEVGYGASICGGVHAINIAQKIESGEILSASAVLNASTTLILSKLEEDSNLTFEEACRKAAEEGVLESDWGIDLDGWDAAAKTAILSNVLFPDQRVSITNVARRGIRDKEAQDFISSLRVQNKRSKKVRLVSELTRNTTSVAPAAVSADSPLAVTGRFNVVLFKTATLGEISVRNLGGGVALTASVIISDLKRIGSKSE